MDNQRKLNHVTPGTFEAQLGDRIAQLAANFNLLLAKLDADAGVTDTDYAATLSVAEIEADAPQ